jgi:hypothetical protein
MSAYAEASTRCGGKDVAPASGAVGDYRRVTDVVSNR